MRRNSPYVGWAIRKALKSHCWYRVSALGFSKRGEFLGLSYNTPRFKRFHGSVHAEMNLIGRYGKKLRTIFIFRVNSTGKLVPITPCDNCQKIADKLGIKIMSIPS